MADEAEKTGCGLRHGLFFTDLYDRGYDAIRVGVRNGELHISFGRTLEDDMAEEFAAKSGIDAGRIVLTGVAADGIVEAIPVQGLPADDDGHDIAGADAIGHHAFIFREEPVAGDAAKRGIFRFLGVVGSRVRKKGIAGAIGFLSENIDITFRAVAELPS